MTKISRGLCGLGKRSTHCKGREGVKGEEVGDVSKGTRIGGLKSIKVLNYGVGPGETPGDVEGDIL